MDVIGSLSRCLLPRLGVVLLVLSCGCSPGYVLRGAYEQAKILSGRRAISSVMSDGEVANETKEKLAFVVGARGFAQEMGLNPGGSFTSYVEVSRDPLAWVVVASRKDAFQLFTWWFPIVGEVPYKGFFDKEDAEAQVAQLGKEGYEGSIRGTEAFSTLGWFNDPVVSTTLKAPPTRVVNTIIHESVHSTVWIKGSVAFNESLANFIGATGAVAYFTEKLRACETSGGACEQERRWLQATERERSFQFELSRVVESLYDSLDALYKDNSRTFAGKMGDRQEIFERAVTPLRATYPSMTVLKTMNNADIIQLKLYLTKLSLFDVLYKKHGSQWGPFLKSIREIQKAVEEGEGKDPFELLAG